MPFRYLGIPIHHKRLKNSDWTVEDRFEKKNLHVGTASTYLLGEGDFDLFQSEQPSSLYVVFFPGPKRNSEKDRLL